MAEGDKSLEHYLDSASDELDKYLKKLNAAFNSTDKVLTESKIHKSMFSFSFGLFKQIFTFRGIVLVVGTALYSKFTLDTLPFKPLLLQATGIFVLLYFYIRHVTLKDMATIDSKRFNLGAYEKMNNDEYRVL